MLTCLGHRSTIMLTWLDRDADFCRPSLPLPNLLFNWERPEHDRPGDCVSGRVHPVGHRRHPAAAGRSHCEGADHAWVAVHQALWDGDEGVGGEAGPDAGHHGWVAQGEWVVPLALNMKHAGWLLQLLSAAWPKWSDNPLSTEHEAALCGLPSSHLVCLLNDSSDQTIRLALNMKQPCVASQVLTLSVCWMTPVIRQSMQHCRWNSLGCFSSSLFTCLLNDPSDQTVHSALQMKHPGGLKSIYFICLLNNPSDQMIH